MTTMCDFESTLVDNLEWLKRKALRFCKEKDIADDIVGEVLYKMLRNRHLYDCSKPFRPWALTILQNTLATYYNRRKLMLFSDFSEVGAVPSYEKSSDYVMMKEKLFIIKRMARRYVSVECLLLYAKGYSYEEIAEIFDIGVGTVKSRLLTGRKILRKSLYAY